MAGPQDFMVGNAPQGVSYAAPLLNFSNIANLPEQYFKGRAANLFAGGVPMLDAQGNPTTDPKLGVSYDTQKIMSMTLQAGGAPAAQALAPYLMTPGDSGDALAQENVRRAAQGLPPVSAGAPSSQPSGANAGPDPKDPQNAEYFEHFVMGGVKQAETGGVRDPYNSVTSTGTGHKVYGAFQVYDDNIPKWTQEALGHSLTPKEFLKDAKAQDAVARYKLGEYVQKYGYAGAARAWLAGEGGMNNPQARDRFGSTPSGYASKVLGYASASRNAAKSATASATPGQAPPVVAAHANSLAGSPAAMGQESGASARPAGADSESAGAQPGGGGASVAGQNGPIATPSSTGASTEPGKAVPQTVGAGGRAVPTTGTTPAAAPPAARQPLPPPADPAETDVRLKNMQAALDGAQAQAQKWAKVPTEVGKTKSVQWQKEADYLRDQIDKRQQFLRGQVAQSPEERSAARAGQTPSDYAATQKIEEARRAEGEQHFKGIQGTETVFNQQIAPYAKALDAQLNNPNGPWTGYGSHTVLDFNRAKAAFGGDKKAAEAQEAFRKNASQLKLGIFALQSALKDAAGEKNQRMFQMQAQHVDQATADLGNTLAGNRYLVEMQNRMGEQYHHIAEMAREYRKGTTPGGVPRTLDDNFYDQVNKYLTTPREQGGGYLWTRQEETNNELIGAPHAPEGLKTQDELFQWQHKVGLSKGDAYRRPNGSYGHALTPKSQ